MMTYTEQTTVLLAMVHERQQTPNPLTLREAAKRLRMTQKDVYTLAEDCGLTINVAIGIAGVGYSRSRLGDYTLEDGSDELEWIDQDWSEIVAGLQKGKQ
jgi:hypothetical protein